MILVIKDYDIYLIVGRMGQVNEECNFRQYVKYRLIIKGKNDVLNSFYHF